MNVDPRPRRINISNFYNASIKDWEVYFHDIFCDRNKQLEPKFIWLKVIEHSTRIAEGIRKRRFFEAVTSVARVFCWTCAFVSSNPDLFGNSSLEDLLWYKYPRACSYCTSPLKNDIRKIIEEKGAVPCKCGPEIEETAQKMSSARHLEDYRKELQKPKSLDDWGKMIDTIYNRRHTLMSLDSICFHFFEEVGEVLLAMRTNSDFQINIPENDYSIDKVKKAFVNVKLFEEFLKKEDPKYKELINATKQAVKEEVADVISWLFSLTSKLLSLRTSFSDYEKGTFDLIQQIPEEKALTKLTGYGILRTPSDSFLNLSSILYIWYANGCTVCNNFQKGKDKCQCSTKITRLFITRARSNDVKIEA